MTLSAFREAIRLLYLSLEDRVWRVTHVERIDYDPDPP